MAISDLIEDKRKVSVASRPTSVDSKPSTKGGWVTGVVSQYNPYGQYNPYRPAYESQSSKGQTYTPKPAQAAKPAQAKRPAQSGETEEVRVPEKRPSWVDELINRIRKIAQPQQINYPKTPQRDVQYPYTAQYWMIPQMPAARNVPAPYSWMTGRPAFSIPTMNRGWSAYGQRLSALADYNRSTQPYFSQRGWDAYGNRLTGQAADWLSRANQMQLGQSAQNGAGWPWPNYWGGGGWGGGGWGGDYAESLRNWYNALMNWRI